MTPERSKNNLQIDSRIIPKRPQNKYEIDKSHKYDDPKKITQKTSKLSYNKY